MERWSCKFAVVTGASSGIGRVIVKDLLQAGLQVIGLARRQPRMEEMRRSLDQKQSAAFHPRECDISDLASVKAAFKWIDEAFGKLHILINNAGMAENSMLLDEDNESLLKRTMDVNFMGCIYCTKAAYKLMKVAMAEGEECHVININSLLGHIVPRHIPGAGLNIYPVAKHAMRTANEVLRRELYKHELMRLSTVSPGLVQTDFDANWKEQDKQKKIPADIEILSPEDVSRSVLFILESPPHVTIAELLIVPTREEY